MIVEAVKRRFGIGEYSIYQRYGGFSFSDRSLVGTHSLYISNLGKVYAHDTGGIFGTEQVVVYDAQVGGLKVTPSPYHISLANADPYHSLQFSFSVNFDEFIQIFHALPKNCFRWEKDFCLYKWETASTMNVGKLEWNEREILLTSEQGYPPKRFPLPKSRIKEIEEINPFTLKIHGQFELEQQVLSRLELFVPKEETIKEIVGQKGKSVFDVIGNDALLFPVSLFLSGKHVPLTMAQSGDKILLLNEHAVQVIKTFSKADRWYYNKQDRTAVVLADRPFVIEAEDKKTQAFFEQELFSDQHRLLSGTYLLNGTWLGKDYQNEQVSILSAQNALQFLMRKDLSLTEPVALDNSAVVVDLDKVIIKRVHQGVSEICMVAAEGRYDYGELDLPLTMPAEHSLGYNQAGQPFWFTHDLNGITFFYTTDKYELIPNHEILEITVADRKDESDFTEIKIRTNRSEKYVMIPTERVAELIKKAYLSAKAPLVHTVPPEQLYLSYARFANDHLSYYLFGQLFVIQDGIQEIIAKNQNRDLRNRELINFLYYAIQGQKRRLDAVSIYLPALWEREHRALFAISAHHQPYRQLQRNLLSLAAQIRHSLHEVENALSAVSSFVVPKADMDQYIQEKTKRGWNQAMWVGGAGLLLGALTGAYALVLPGLFMGLNTYISSNEMKQLEEMKRDNEYLRLDFFMRKALEAYEHFMTTQMPYYVSELNHHVTSFFQELAVPVQAALDDPAVKERLLGKLADYYTFKQLPIDGSVITKKAVLVEKVQASLALADQHIQLLAQEVSFHVPESTAVPRLPGE
ncbi:hypothetical protein [Brevibacillus marinus]|uniref:hypothetical protein n=1 Tax=Brevibacillus marinus TaxID=2496837 RepID=UPI000F83C39A|nr:hypothetical protein [Brevibacillus marinus]